MSNRVEINVPNSRDFRQFSLVKSSQITTVSINWPEETLKAENLAILCFLFLQKNWSDEFP